MVDGRHIQNRFLAIYLSSRLPDFSEMLRRETVFHRISAMGQILAFYRTYFFVFLVQFGLRRAPALRIVSDTLV